MRSRIPTLPIPTTPPPAEEITPTFLEHFTSSSDLTLLTSLEFSLDSTSQQLDLLGLFLPKLANLRLSHSLVPCLRDFGLTFTALRSLNLSRSGLSDLSGISGLPRLEELYASFNCVSQLAPVSQCDFLFLLDLEGNEVADPGELQYLGFALKLRELNLACNPIYDHLTVDQVLKCLPNLVVLDDISVEASSMRPTALPTPEVSERRNEEDIVLNKLKKGNVVRPSTASARFNTTTRGTSGGTTTGGTTTGGTTTGGTTTSGGTTGVVGDVVVERLRPIEMARRKRSTAPIIAKTRSSLTGLSGSSTTSGLSGLSGTSGLSSSKGSKGGKGSNSIDF